MNDTSDRNIHCMVKNEREQAKKMAEQIEKTNKLARTVLAMSDDSTTTPEIAGEMEELDEEEKSGSTTGTVAISAANSFRERLSGAPETNLVAEFTFFASLVEKTKQDTNVPTTRELQAQVSGGIINF